MKANRELHQLSAKFQWIRHQLSEQLSVKPSADISDSERNNLLLPLQMKAAIKATADYVKYKGRWLLCLVQITIFEKAVYCSFQTVGQPEGCDGMNAKTATTATTATTTTATSKLKTRARERWKTCEGRV